MNNPISKSRFKAHALEYFRQVERTGQSLIITDRGQPVLKVVPYKGEVHEALLSLRDTVVRYVAPTKPLPGSDWEAGR